MNILSSSAYRFTRGPLGQGPMGRIFRVGVLLAVLVAPMAGRAAVAPSLFTETDLVSDQKGKAKFQDPDLVDAWGVAFAPGQPFWVADNGSGKSTLYSATGVKVSSPVVIIANPDANVTSAPTGQVYNGNYLNFKGDQFIFDTENGAIVGWKAPMGNASVVRVDRSGSGAVYKGLALVSTTKGAYLLAANFNSGNVDVFDSNYQPATLKGKFADPKTPKGYAPFNVAVLGTSVYVAYALQGPGKHDEVDGDGDGFVSIFKTDGTFVKRFASGTGAGGKGSPLIARGGRAIAPAGFGTYARDVLVGNFGTGEIAVFTPGGVFVSLLHKNATTPVIIPGLWAIVFGAGGTGDPSRLYFTAGPGDETHGLFGYLQYAKAKVTKPPAGGGGY